MKSGGVPARTCAYGIRGPPTRCMLVIHYVMQIWVVEVIATSLKVTQPVGLAHRQEPLMSDGVDQRFRTWLLGLSICM
jgi:hypothetical protein